ncbi:MAG: aldo/keto reductase, partial [Lachnospiraceae bacterium]|nr:aldo/keto reductase [Lachnospiraceae bacterium]
KNGLKEAVGKAGKGLITFSPLAQGLLTDRYLKGIPEDSRMKTDGRFLKEDRLTEETLSSIRKLNEIAEQRGQSLAVMALSWILENENVTSVLVGASRASQLLDSLGCISGSSFSDEELSAIDRISLPSPIDKR